MNKKTLFALWGGLYILCAALGFIPEPEGFTKAIMVMLSVGFFVPGFLLLREYSAQRNEQGLKLLRLLCVGALVLDTVLIVVNILSYNLSSTAGQVLYWILIIVGSPLVCSQYWIVVLFLWALLLMFTISHIREMNSKKDG